MRGARLAAGRLALLRTRSGRNLLTGSEVVLTSPRGGEPRTVLRAVDGSVPNALDFDGRQVAAIARGCRRMLSVRHLVDGPAGRAPAGTGCRLRLAAPLEVTRRGLAVRLSCEGFIAPCETSGVQLRPGGPRGRLIARSRRRTPFTSTFTLRLAKSVRRRLRGRLVTLSADVSDRYGAPFAAPRRSVTARVVP